MSVRLVVTPGDPRGVGPAVATRAVERVTEDDPTAVVVIVGPEGPIGPEELAELAGRHRGRSRGGTDADAGAFAARAIERAVELALDDEAAAIVTGPIHKPSLHAAGHDVPGHTEMLARLTGARRVGMLMTAERTRLGPPLRVLLATTHLPLRDVPDVVDESLLVEQSRLLHDALVRDWAIDTPRLGLCALNPHASDGGLFGDEEARIMTPAVERLRAAGIDITGPEPADTVFARALEAAFDAVVAPYHDVGMAAFKTVSFGSGVNVTLGLPFVRTSPDHGTAFGIAGSGHADPGSMIEALRLASRLASRRFDTSPADV